MKNCAKFYIEASNNWFAVAKSSKKDGEVNVLNPFYYLVVHAVELRLKAFLLSCGDTEDEIRKLGHEIDSLLERSKEYDLIIENVYKDFLDNLYSINKKHFLRYYNHGATVNSPVHFVLPETVIVYVQRIFKQIDDLLSNREKR
jgi:hypothetical protein